jgi:uncharacterized membrane protein
MAALAYVLLPISGLLAYFNGSTARMRWHGLQAIAIGTLWPAALYAASAISTRASQVVWAAGAIGWLVMMVLAGAGKDARIPIIGRVLQRLAAESPKVVR